MNVEKNALSRIQNTVQNSTEVVFNKRTGLSFVPSMSRILGAAFAIFFLILSTPMSHSALVHYFPFDGNANDVIGSSNGTVNGATLTTGFSGQAYNFDGNDFIATLIDIRPSVVPNFTMGAWARPTNSSPIRQVISGDGGNFHRSLGIDNRGVGGPDANPGWSAFTGTGVLGPVTVELNEWVFLAVSYDNGSNTMTLMVDETVVSGASGFNGAGASFTDIGRNPIGGGIEFFAGDIDEVFFYDETLSVSQLNDIRVNGVTGAQVPEPSTYLMFATMLGGAGVLVFRHRRKEQETTVSEENEAIS